MLARTAPQQAIFSDVLHIQISVICSGVNYAVALSVKTQVDLVLLSSDPEINRTQRHGILILPGGLESISVCVLLILLSSYAVTIF